ncbi:polyribonucleotide nucleotidyltransferase [candidate division WWE3 bacterium]|jgi:polyribonucleotide nucleotidyltransferase|uniref:Polyribonucleotide nucleotidyltransferase n=1 Tax=candidate division WWE3 bacterium TaxID=2053526 RepID=A0A3A4ZE51_UNCKA|nr:MAG: polyribonucleotide nucleotidyltransferase [candidate division WWE3 bacterium]
MNKKYVKKEIELAGKKLVLETGELAFLANMAVKATYGDTVILVTVVAGEANPDLDFFPLTVNYEEKLYASGLIKSSRFVKRDGRPNDEAIISKRLIDHAVRPLFPNDYMDAVQVVATVLSLDETSDPEFVAMNAVSAALYASDIPWNGPMVTAKVGYVDNGYIMNPERKILEDESDLDLTVSFAGKDKKFLAIEAKANILPEEKILGAIEFARDGLTPVLKLIEEFAAEVNPDNHKYEYESKALGEDLMKDVSEIAKERIHELMKSELDKTEMTLKQDEIRDEVLIKYEGKYKKVDMLRAISELEKKAIQHIILDEGKRPDGRGITDIRAISSKVGLLPRTHGSALFTRGVTQVLTVATLGSPSLELIVQDMYGEDTKRYIHYYNFPPYASGETGNMGSPKSRDIGHGMLAEKALLHVIPSQKEFPYMILLVSETLSSSGSSSMAATCASSLALMDAGVPIKDMVGGIGVGLITNDDFTKYKIMTDLAYMEDAFGFLDFKMTGTRNGVTAIQSDMKMQGIPMDMLPKIFEQSKEGRLKVLDEMEKSIKKPREGVSEYAPKMVTLQIDPDKIGMVIGAGGKTIKEIQEKTSTEIFIDQEGTVVVTSTSKENAQKAAEIIDGITHEVKVGEVYEGEVVELLDFGALVEILPGRVGLMHISEITTEYVEKIDDWVHIGDKVTVKVINTSDDGKIGLSRRAMDPDYVPNENRGGQSGGRKNFRGRDRDPRRGRNHR